MSAMNTLTRAVMQSLHSYVQCAFLIASVTALQYNKCMIGNHYALPVDTLSILLLSPLHIANNNTATDCAVL
jgi:hypothetical protein